MGRHTIKRELGADADADDHEAELVIQAVSQHAPQVILQHGIKDREYGHCRADPNKHFGTGKATRESIDGEFCGEYGEHHGTCDRGFGISVLQPVMQQWESTFDTKSQEDQPSAWRFETEMIEGNRAGCRDMDDQAG